MLKLIGAILRLVPAILVALILFLINPILGVLWVLWMTVLVIYVVKKDILINLARKFLDWLFRVNK